MKHARSRLASAVALLLAAEISLIAQERASAPPEAPAARYGLDPADRNPSANPCKDYYEYADGGWLKRNPVPPEYPSWGSFNELRERNRTALREILERLAKEKRPAGSDEQKLGDFYAGCMDETAIEAAGAHPLAAELDRIEKIRTVADLEPELARLHERGVHAIFRFGSQQDRRNSSEVIGGVSQSGLGMPDRTTTRRRTRSLGPFGTSTSSMSAACSPSSATTPRERPARRRPSSQSRPGWPKLR